MITATIPITGTIREIRDGRIYVSSGNRQDSYNQRYYRPCTAPHEIRRQAPRKDETFANLLKLAMLARIYPAKDMYVKQYLTMMPRHLAARREVTTNDGRCT